MDMSDGRGKHEPMLCVKDAAIHQRGCLSVESENAVSLGRKDGKTLLSSYKANADREARIGTTAITRNPSKSFIPATFSGPRQFYVYP
jgi:hypothetical protein